MGDNRIKRELSELMPYLECKYKENSSMFMHALAANFLWDDDLLNLKDEFFEKLSEQFNEYDEIWVDFSEKEKDEKVEIIYNIIKEYLYD